MDVPRPLLELVTEHPELIRADPTSTVEAVIDQLERRIGRQLAAIVAHPAVRRLEGSWRGLRLLVDQLDASGSLAVEVMTINQKTLVKLLRKWAGATWDQSPLYHKLITERLRTSFAQPFSALLIDAEFHHPGDRQALTELAHLGEAACLPILTAAAPAMMQCRSWSDLDATVLRTRCAHPSYLPWRSLRDSDSARFLYLVAPRLATRAAYGPGDGAGVPIDEHGDRPVCVGGYALAARMLALYRDTGWFAHVSHGDAATPIPPSAGDAPLDASFDAETAAALQVSGFTVLVARNGAAVLPATPSFAAVRRAGDADVHDVRFAERRLDHIACGAALVRTLIAFVRDNFVPMDDLAAASQRLQRFLDGFVASPATARRPFAAAHVALFEAPGEPGFVAARLRIAPGYELDLLPYAGSFLTRLRRI